MDRVCFFGFLSSFCFLVRCLIPGLVAAPLMANEDATQEAQHEFDDDQDPLKIIFDGVDYSQDKELAKEGDDCYGEYLRCAVNSQYFEHLCGIDSFSWRLRKPQRDFSSICDLDFQNCMIARIYMVGLDPKTYPPHWEYEGEGKGCRYSCKELNSNEVNCVPLIIKEPTTSTTTEPPETTTKSP